VVETAVRLLQRGKGIFALFVSYCSGRVERSLEAAVTSFLGLWISTDRRPKGQVLAGTGEDVRQERSLLQYLGCV